MFFMLRPLRFGVASGQKMMYQTLHQILDNCLGGGSGSQISIGPHDPELFKGGANLYALTDEIYHGQTTSASTTTISLRDLLLGSQRLRRSLARICTVKNLKVTDSEITTYCFDEAKLIKILVGKHNRIRRHLAQKYEAARASERQTSSSSGAAAGLIIKQEAKKVKSEGGAAQEEVKTSEPIIAQATSAYEHMYTTVAAGMIADELPKDLVSKFLEAIQEHESTIYQGVAPPQQTGD